MGKTSKKGQTIPKVVEEEVRRCRNLGTYVKADFWVNLFADFELAESYASLLVYPVGCEGDDGPAPELLDALAELNNENKVKCKVWPLESALSYIDSMNKVTTYGLLSGCLPSQKVSRNLIASAHVAILKMWWRTPPLVPPLIYRRSESHRVLDMKTL